MKRAPIVMLLALAACGDDGKSPNDYSRYDCKDPVTSNLPDGNHNPGKDCQGSCHDHGFTIAGTVFMDASASAPAVGATVTAYDGKKTITMVTASNGNFYTKETFDTPISLQHPYQVWVSSCPDVEIMPDSIDMPNSNTATSCNQGVCHNNQAGTGVITLRQ